MQAQKRLKTAITTLAGAAAAIVGLSYAPSVLAFPYEQSFGATQVHAEQPIAPRMRDELARADALLAASPINIEHVPRDIYLTNGGWRWKLLAFQSSHVFAFRRPWSDAIIVNRTDIVDDRVRSDRPIANVRTLSGVIAHETTHILLARRFGEWRMRLAPSWKQESYADYVAQESSLPDDQAGRLRLMDGNDPAVFYYDARRRVAAYLVAHQGRIDKLFE